MTKKGSLGSLYNYIHHLSHDLSLQSMTRVQPPLRVMYTYAYTQSWVCTILLLHTMRMSTKWSHIACMHAHLSFLDAIHDSDYALHHTRTTRCARQSIGVGRGSCLYISQEVKVREHGRVEEVWSDRSSRYKPFRRWYTLCMCVCVGGEVTMYFVIIELNNQSWFWVYMQNSNPHASVKINKPNTRYM